MLYQCEAVHQAEQPVLSIRTRTPVQNLPQVIGEAYAEIAGRLHARFLQPSGDPFVAYYNMDMNDLDVEIGFPVAAPLAGQGRVQPGSIPAGMMATCVYTGPYHEMVPAYQELTEWIEVNGHEATGVTYEFYLNDPAQTTPAELKTRIMFPLKANV